MDKILTEDDFFMAQQHAIKTMQDKARHPHDRDQAHQARCWADGLIRVLNSKGFVVIEKHKVDKHAD